MDAPRRGSRLPRPTDIAVRSAAVFLAFVLLLGGALPVRADGYIVDIRPRGIAGPQADAAALSPVPLLAPTAPLWLTYEVQPGDTLSAIAARAGTDVATLVARNGLDSSDRIVPGQVLRLDGTVTPALALPADVSGVAIARLVPYLGRWWFRGGWFPR